MPKYKGRLISLTQPTTSGTPYTGVANGIWSSQDELVAINAGVWTKGLTVPNMPTIGSAIAANNSSAVSFTAPSDIGGSPITSYVAKSNLGATITGATSPITFTGLTNGTAYTFTVAALNAQGTGFFSSTSNLITPNSAIDVIYTVVGAGGGASQRSYESHGGGGGQVINGTTGMYPDIIYNITVGSGGAGGNSTNAGTGGSSSLGVDISAVGGAGSNGYTGAASGSGFYGSGGYWNGGGGGGNGGGAGGAASQYVSGVGVTSTVDGIMYGFGGGHSFWTNANGGSSRSYRGDGIGNGGDGSAYYYYIYSPSGSNGGVLIKTTYPIGVASSTCTYTQDLTTSVGNIIYTFTTSGTMTLGTDATFGIFALGASTKTRVKYTFAGDTITTATASTTNSYGGTSAGNRTLGIFAFGGSTSVNRDKYTYATDVNSVATSASGTVNFDGQSSAGNSTLGIFSLNGNQTTRNKYVYATDVNSVATSGSMTQPSSGCATGNAEVGIFVQGYNWATQGPSTTRDKYTYATDVNSVATASSAASQNGGAIGNKTIGIIALGTVGVTGVTTRDKYTYATNVNSVATASSVATTYSGMSTAGNSISGIFIRYGGASDKYTYSGDVNSSATSSATSNLGSATSNGILGVNA